jgi:hypothetical protein
LIAWLYKTMSNDHLLVSMQVSVVKFVDTFGGGWWLGILDFWILWG